MSRFVVATRENNAELAILRSYKNSKASESLYNECKVWEACCATSAATTFFDPIAIGKFGQTFADGGVLYNNPIQLIDREAKSIWPGRDAMIVSIGTGSAPNNSFTGNIKDIVEAMSKILTQTERTANDFYQSHIDMVKDNLLFRFSVTHGLADVGLEEYKEVPRITDATETYLDHGETGGKLAACIKRLLGADSEGTDAMLISSQTG
jgi:predicted acylesterase/phospholipase RssA